MPAGGTTSPTLSRLSLTKPVSSCPILCTYFGRHRSDRRGRMVHNSVHTCGQRACAQARDGERTVHLIRTQDRIPSDIDQFWTIRAAELDVKAEIAPQARRALDDEGTPAGP